MEKPLWASTQRSYIFVFNVKRGLCIFIRTPLNHGLLYDLGNSEDFNPSDFLKEHIIKYLDKYNGSPVAQTIISHPHYDHFSDIKCLVEPDKESSPFKSALHTCPHDKTVGSESPEALNWDRVTKGKEKEHEAFDIYRDIYDKRNLPLQTIQYNTPLSIPNLSYSIYYVRPPILDKLFEGSDQDYINGTSIVLHYKHGMHTILLTGDINPAAMKIILEEEEGLEKRCTVFSKSTTYANPEWYLKTLDQPSLKNILGEGLDILVAPHHGLESCYSNELFEAIKGNKPKLNVISESRSTGEGSGTVSANYQSESGATGLNVMVEGEIENRYSVTTKNGHHILIKLNGTSGTPDVYLEKIPDKLLERMP